MQIWFEKKEVVTTYWPECWSPKSIVVAFFREREQSCVKANLCVWGSARERSINFCYVFNQQNTRFCSDSRMPVCCCFCMIEYFNHNWRQFLSTIGYFIFELNHCWFFVMKNSHKGRFSTNGISLQMPIIASCSGNRLDSIQHICHCNNGLNSVERRKKTNANWWWLSGLF